MLRLVRKRHPGDAPLPRVWLVFFGDAAGPNWWARMLAPGYRHVSAACWHVEEKRWVYFNPTRRGLVIELYGEGSFPFAELVRGSTATLRFVSRFDRTGAPAVFHCVGAIKALLGIRSRAFRPIGLFRDLLARGAEIVDAPRGESLGQRFQQAADAGSAAGRS